MLKYSIQRLLYGVTVLIGIVFAVFFLFDLMPADAARMTMGQRADIASLEAIEAELGLNKPAHERLLLYLKDLSPIAIVANTDFKKYKAISIYAGKKKSFVLKAPYLRRSFQSNKRVGELILEKFPNTAVLAVSSMLLATFLGIFLGIVAAVKKDSFIDRLAISISTIGISMPSFFAAIIMAWVFGFLLRDYTGLNMTGSLYTFDAFEGEKLALKNLILPMLTLGIRPLAVIVQLTRNSLLDVLKKDYIRTAKAKGLPFKKVLLKHALKNAMNPVLTAVTGWFASLLAGAFFVEFVFGWNGLGKLTVDALETADFPVIMGAILFVGLIFVFLNLLTDILYALLNPRIQLS